MTPHAPSLRYSRHIALPGFGADGQRRIAASRVLIVGLGGLGSPAAMYLAAAGVGRLSLNDFDRVDASNLQRQLLFGDAQVGMRKTAAACATLTALNPGVELEPIDARLQGNALHNAVTRANVVIDGSDNFGTRFAVNRACVAARTPLVSGAALRFDGQFAVFRADLDGAPCYRCLFDDTDEATEDCAGNGVLAPLVGVIGSLMAVETLKLLTGTGPAMHGRLLRYDALTGDFRTSHFSRDPECPVCHD